jgi:predicted phage baseplate assembly protein
MIDRELNTYVGPIKEKSENTGIELLSSTKDDEIISEFALIQEIEDNGAKIILDSALKNIYDRSSVTISANVALATHGENIAEILGNGDGSHPNQRFILSQSPLTHVSAQTPSGSETSLQVRVNDLLWREVATLYGRGQEDHVYITRIDDDGKTTVQFGDGQKGARLPSGQHNVGAVYRKGIGLGGMVKAGQIDLLMSRPLGLKGAVNPLPSSGAQDRQSLADARRNAPLTVLTLDRVVSLQDYEDYARAFAGVAKSLATWTWDGEKRGVLVTVAGPKGYVIKKDEVIYKNILNSMRKFGDPYVPLMVSSYRPASFRISANVKVSAENKPEERVFAAVEQKLRDHFSFDARNFGQAVTLSEVIAVMQNVPGVMAVSIKALYRTDKSGQPGTILQAAMPRSGDKTIDEAELLILDPAPIDLKVMP